MRIADKTLSEQIKFIRSFIDKFTYHEYVGSGQEKACFPKKNKRSLLHSYRNRKYKYIKNGKFLEHIAGIRTLGFTNDEMQEHCLLMLDLDPKLNDTNSKQSLFKAQKIIEKILKQQVYWEPSTGYSSTHGYIIVQKKGWVGAFNDAIQVLAQFLTNSCPMLARVEICGCPNEKIWEKNLIVDIKMSQPAKLPRFNGPRLIQNTAYIDSCFLYELTQHKPVVRSTIKSGGYRGISHVINELTGVFLNEHGDFKLTNDRKKRKVYASHLAITLALFYLCTKNQNQVSYALIEKHWQNLNELGITDIKFNTNTFSYCKQYLIRNNFLDYVEERYFFGNEEEKGQAPRYKLDTGVQNILRKAVKGGVMSSTSFDHVMAREKNERVFAVLDFTIKYFASGSRQMAA